MNEKYGTMDFNFSFEDYLKMKKKYENHSQQNSNEGQTISDNMGSPKNSVHGKVSASSETRAYGLQATLEQSDYKSGSNMETIGDVRLKSSEVVSLLNDGTSRSSKSSADTPNKSQLENKIE